LIKDKPGFVMTTAEIHPQVVHLTKSSRADLDFILSCESQPDANPFIFPWSREAHLAAFENPDCAHLLIKKNDSDESLGFILLYGLTSPNRSIEFRRIVVAKSGFGVGRASVRTVVDFAFKVLNAHRVWLDVKSKNSRARHLYASEGFTAEGVLRECILESDGFESLVLMSILCREWEASSNGFTKQQDSSRSSIRGA
jgi:diamine N-acetyltransferase